MRRHPLAGPIAFSRGLEIRVTVDDLSFEGGSAILLGSVLHQYFARHVSMNSFAQTVLSSLDAWRRDDLDAASWREGRAVNAPGELGVAAAPRAQSRRRCSPRLADEAPRSTSSRRCAGSSAPFPTSRVWAMRCGPVEEPFRFAQEPSLDLRARSGCRLRAFGRRWRRRDWCSACSASSGRTARLPIHLTEYARERQLYNGDRTFGRFLDTLLHRFGLFFYRAWARAQPVVALDRPDDAPIVRHIGSLFGLIEPSARNRDALGDFPKLFFAGRLARSVRDADGLEAWLHASVRRAGARSTSSRATGCRSAARNALASCATASRPSVAARCSAEAVWDVQHKFRIVIGPAWPGSALLALLPDGRRSSSCARWCGSTSASSSPGTCA